MVLLPSPCNSSFSHMTTTSEIVSVEPEFLSDRSRSSPLFAVGEFSFFFFLNTVQVQAEEATEGSYMQPTCLIKCRNGFSSTKASPDHLPPRTIVPEITSVII
ncbi:hypothetical protein QL285_033629 [Trifolium repens]|nr:hypothetical protein QL285_033629 [Trifolium repens]